MATVSSDSKSDGKRSNPQDTNPDTRNTTAAVTPEPLKSPIGSEAPLAPAAGLDPDSVIRAAKHTLAAAGDDGNDKAEADIERARKAREGVSRRNAAKHFPAEPSRSHFGGFQTAACSPSIAT